MTEQQLQGQTIAFLATRGVEQVELTSPWEAVKAAGGQPVLVSPESDSITAMNGDWDTTVPARRLPWAARRTTHERVLEPRSIYLMRGVVRREFEHSIPPVETLRYSITFRTLRK